jgi:PilZ domain
MGGKANRRSDRISIVLPVEATGIDSENLPFTEATTTIVVNRHGALISLMRSLEPGKTVALRRQFTDGSRREAEAKIVVRQKNGAERWAYGVAFLNPETDFWGIEFPSAAQSDNAVVRILVECSHCHSHELAYLDGRELKEFEANRLFARHCRTCDSPTIWKQPQEPASRHAAMMESHHEAANAIMDAASSSPSRIMPRYDTRLTACVRQGGEEEMAVCENVSRLGIAFRSRRKFAEGTQIEVAVPYTPGTANVFVPAVIVHAKPLPTAGLHRHGARYLPKDQ